MERTDYLNLIIDRNKNGTCDRCKEKITDSEENLKFFLRIIQRFKDLFDKLFGKKKENNYKARMDPIRAGAAF